MRPGHVFERDRFPLFVHPESAIAGVVSEAVFDANDDPERGVRASITSVKDAAARSSHASTSKSLPKICEYDTEAQGNEEEQR